MVMRHQNDSAGATMHVLSAEIVTVVGGDSVSCRAGYMSAIVDLRASSETALNSNP